MGLISGDELKVIRIKNTLKLDVIEVSRAYREEIAEREDLEPLSDARPMRFDRDGNLPADSDEKGHRFRGKEDTWCLGLRESPC